MWGKEYPFFNEVQEYCYSFMQSANIFLNKDGSVKLGDMNVSKVAKKGLLYT